MPKLTLDMIMTAAEADAYLGFCLACGAEHDGIEPDARRYTCTACGARKVYGAEELILMFG
jgi:DNA-directed RNA polymerase subunit RPC12/RpoP